MKAISTWFNVFLLHINFRCFSFQIYDYRHVRIQSDFDRFFFSDSGYWFVLAIIYRIQKVYCQYGFTMDLQFASVSARTVSNELELIAKMCVLSNTTCTFINASSVIFSKNTNIINTC